MKELDSVEDKINSSDDLDFLNYLKILWVKKKFIIKITIIFLFFGLFLAIFSRNQFLAETIIVPQTNEKQSLIGNLGGLAAAAGINLSKGEGTGISPQLYPQILNSITFQKELLETPIRFSEGAKKISYIEYYNKIYKPGFLENLKKYTIGLPGIIMNLFKDIELKNKGDYLDDSLIRVTKNEKKLMEQLNKQLSIGVMKDQGYVRLSAVMPSAIAAADITKAAQKLLQKYIINFKIQKSKLQLDFIKNRFLEKEEEFKKVQNKLADYRDKNQNINSARAQTNLERLKSDYDLAYSVYSELAKNLESQEIQVKEDTPVFTIIQPVSIPIEKSSPKVLLIIFGWGVAGVTISLFLVFYELALKNLKKQFKVRMT